MFEGMEIVWAHRTELLDGLSNTTLLSIIGAFGALVFGAILCVILMGHNKYLRIGVRGFVDLMRCTPFLLLAYFFYYGLPSLGLRFENWTVGIYALIIYNAAYVAEILRAAWSNLPHEEIEAARAFGYYGGGLLRRIIFPRVFVNSMPVLGNQFIQVIKDTSFLTIIAVPELTYTANNIQSNYYLPFSAFVAAVLLYWLLCLSVDAIVGIVRHISEKQQ